jgi:uncharacterized protein (DUF2147 family)
MLLMLACTRPSAADSTTIEGRWRIADDKTGGTRAVVEIRRDGAGALGRIVEFYPRPGEDGDPVCEDCPGEDRGRRIRGLVILRLEGRDDRGRWKGFVLDPEEGRRYHCVVTLADAGSRLDLHGYVGLPIFGRSERWSRTQ